MRLVQSKSKRAPRDRGRISKIKEAANRRKRQLRNYKKQQLPSDIGVTVKPVHGQEQSFIPEEALKESDEAKHLGEPDTKVDFVDPYSEERINRSTPALDSSEETLGG